MSTERLVKTALLEAVVGRLLSETLGTVASMVLALGRGMDDLASGLFYIELDAARRYKLLTGEDLGAGAGQVDRHTMQPIPLDDDSDD